MLDYLKEQHKNTWWLRAIIGYPIVPFILFSMTSVIFVKIVWLCAFFTILSIICLVVGPLSILLIMFFQKKIREKVIITYSLNDNYHVILFVFIIPLIILLISLFISKLYNL